MSLVLDTNNLRKIKILVDDYPHARDASLRMILHHCTQNDLKVLEEILFSSIQTTTQNLVEALNLSPSQLETSVNLFMTAGLIKNQGQILVIDKELRKFFELEIQRFEQDFEPGIDFIAQLLKKVPIHILPVWYSLPRTSTNIFESIVEKYLYTPQIYQRTISEIQTYDPLLKTIIDLLFSSDHLELDLEFLQNHLSLSPAALFDTIALLEFSLIASVGYRQDRSSYKGYLTPFSEFKHYLLHLRATECTTLADAQIHKITLAPFAFIEGLFTLLNCFKNKGYHYPLDRLEESELKEALAEDNLAYLDLEELMQKLVTVHLMETKNNQIALNESSYSFLSMKLESAALLLYRHPLNKPCVHLAIPTDKAIRECEKAAVRLLGKGWVLLEEFVKGMVVPFSDEEQVHLRKKGRKWVYHLPTYTTSDQDFIHHIFTDWFEKVGVIETGFVDNKPTLRLTSLGMEIFS
jgi:hypothetical protein